MPRTDDFKDISVILFKEGDRSRQIKIPVRVYSCHAQSEWTSFINNVMYKLHLEEIEGIYEDIDGAPVARIASLIDGGLYFARLTETCALLRSLTTQEMECYPSWPSIEEGLKAKKDLECSIEQFQSFKPSSMYT
ncbi:unnamed protein product, partial [Choristocarpus tenellus]